MRLGGYGSRFIIPRAYGGLGYAIPTIVGAHYARPEARLVGLFGDGSLGMSAGELETLARLNIPAVMIHFNNGMFGWIKALQKLHCQEKYFSVDFQTGDMSALASVFELKATTSMPLVISMTLSTRPLSMKAQCSLMSSPYRRLQNYLQFFLGKRYPGKTDLRLFFHSGKSAIIAFINLFKWTRRRI